MAHLEWDSDQELVTLEPEHIEDVLRRYLAGQFSEELVETWAGAIEGREDIGMRARNEDLLRELISELDNPALHRPLSKEYARSILSRIQETRLDA